MGGGSAVATVPPGRHRAPPLPVPSVAPAGGAGEAPRRVGERGPGRMTKEDKKKMAREEASEEIRILLDGKPTKREVRNFLFRRLAKLRA